MVKETMGRAMEEVRGAALGPAQVAISTTGAVAKVTIAGEAITVGVGEAETLTTKEVVMAEADTKVTTPMVTTGTSPIIAKTMEGPQGVAQAITRWGAEAAAEGVWDPRVVEAWVGACTLPMMMAFRVRVVDAVLEEVAIREILARDKAIKAKTKMAAKGTSKITRQ